MAFWASERCVSAELMLLYHCRCCSCWCSKFAVLWPSAADPSVNMLLLAADVGHVAACCHPL